MGKILCDGQYFAFSWVGFDIYMGEEHCGDNDQRGLF